jgi:hypothetical protein
MSDTRGTKQKERVSKIRHKPERESVLRRTFAASQHHATNPVQTSAYHASTGPGGRPSLAAKKIQASESRLAHDFTQIPTHTSRGTGGLRPGISPDDSHNYRLGGAVGGMADTGNAVGAALGNVLGGAAAMLTGIDISTNDTSPAAWFPHGAFRWHIGFSTTGTNGWIVQKVTNTYGGEDSIGGAINNATVGVTPRYYEAWEVDAAGTVSPSAGATNDMFERPDLSTDPAFMDPNTKGRFSMVGEVYFTTTDPATSGLAPNGIPDAGILLAGLTEPADLGVARLHRYANGTWDSTVAPPTHSGSNR